LGLTPGEAWLRRDEPKPPAMVERFEAAIAQLDRGAPFAYAVGRVSFRSLDLAIDPRALIPRPETEGLVDLVLGARGLGVSRATSAPGGGVSRCPWRSRGSSTA